jgi:hypothetical protein
MTATAQEAPEVFEALAPPSAEERYTAWAAGRHDEGMGFAVGGAGWQCSDPIAPVLYEIHVLADNVHNLPDRRRRAREWAFTMAASYAASARIRYGLEWGRQAALDGLVLGLMDKDDTRAELGLMTNEERAERFGIGRNRYARVRAHVRDLTKSLLSEFEGFMKSGLD